MTPRRAIAVRVVTVIAAAFMVVAFSLALLFPAAMSLAELLTMFHDRALVTVQAFAHDRLPGWVWSRLLTPVLVRPAWLGPMAFGVVAAGVALSLRSQRQAPRSRRRRS